MRLGNLSFVDADNDGSAVENTTELRVTSEPSRFYNSSILDLDIYAACIHATTCTIDAISLHSSCIFLR